MSWVWSLPLMPFLLCGLVCIGPVLVALVVGHRQKDKHD